jgi:hypothetical protein
MNQAVAPRRVAAGGSWSADTGYDAAVAGGRTAYVPIPVLAALPLLAVQKSRLAGAPFAGGLGLKGSPTGPRPRLVLLGAGGLAIAVLGAMVLSGPAARARAAVVRRN